MPNALVYFTVTGHARDVEQPLPSGSSITPMLDDVSGYVDFFPGDQFQALPTGLETYASDLDLGGGVSADTVLPIAPITGRFINGNLCTIAIGDPEGVALLANSPFLNLESALYYHVRFRNVTYGGAVQRLSNFAFAAPADASGVLLSSTTLTRVTYGGP